jgi:collagen type I/II/III/V/XI/XXIV/XXVII alpha
MADYLWRGSGNDLTAPADWIDVSTGAPAASQPGPGDNATIGAAPALDVTGTLTVGHLILAGELGLAATGAVAIGGAVVQLGTVAIGAGGMLAGCGRLDAPVALGGTLAAQGGALGLFGDVVGSGTLTIGAGATLFAAGAVGAGLSAAFQGPGGTLELFTTAARFDAAITGFGAGDAIDIAGATLTGADWSAGTLTLGAASSTLTLSLPGSFASSLFLTLPDGFGGSLVKLANPATLPAAAGTLTLAQAPTLYEGAGSAAAVLAAGTVALGGALQAGSVDAQGLLAVLSGGTLDATTLTLRGTLDATGAVAIGAGTPAAGTVALAVGAALEGSGCINGALEVDGTLVARGGALGLFGDVTGSGTLAIGAGATLFAAGAVGPGLTVAFGLDATLDLAQPAAFAAGLAGLAPGDALDLEFASLAGLPIASALNGLNIHTTSDGAGGTLVTVACYALGTRLATPGGEVAVESLRAGDAVLALEEGAWVARRVRWVGRASVDLARHPDPARAAPVRIRADAFAPGVPHRDLVLSPEHAIFVDGILVQAQALLNGATVVQEFPARITYLHVELDRHAVLLAEGLPAESYLDTGNRMLFAGEAGVRPLHPDLVGAIAWDERACAPLHLGGGRVAAAHARLLARAQTLGWTLTTDPDLRLVAAGEGVRLVSRSFVPAWLGLGADRRRLGVAVASARLGGRRLPRTAFGPGWHAPEAGWRWTDGEALLKLPPNMPRRAPPTIRLAEAGARYWLEAAASAASTAGARGIGATAPYPSVLSAAATAA